MLKPALLPALVACALAAACGGAPAPTAKSSNSNAQTTNAQTSIQHGTSPSSNVGVAASHGGDAQTGAATKPPVETPELDAKIEKAEAKAKAAGASDSDKKAAARAYFDRANFFRDQGTPALYKFALADYRRGLRYDSSDADARAKMNEIVDIYKSMGRPVPELGNEQ
jgi:hypothetical protein